MLFCMKTVGIYTKVLLKTAEYSGAFESRASVACCTITALLCKGVQKVGACLILQASSRSMLHNYRLGFSIPTCKFKLMLRMGFFINRTLNPAEESAQNHQLCSETKQLSEAIFKTLHLNSTQLLALWTIRLKKAI